MNLQLNKLWSDSTKVPVTVGIVSFIAGVGAGYGISYIRNRTKVEVHMIPKETALFEEAELQKYIEDGKAALEKAAAEEDISSHVNPADLGRAFVEEVIRPSPEDEVVAPDPEPEVVEPVAKSIFAGSTDEWDYEKEVESRSTDQPYVLHRDEFFADEKNYAQISLTFYKGDDILVDEDDAPVYNYSQVVGPMKFGHGSDDQNVFYVRNDKRRAEYEIILDSGTYAKEVLGLDIEHHAVAQDLKHSHHTPRFTMD